MPMQWDSTGLVMLAATLVGSDASPGVGEAREPGAPRREAERRERRGWRLRTQQGALIHPQQPRQPLAVGVALDRVGHILDQRQHLGGDLVLDLGIVQIAARSQGIHDVLDDRLGSSPGCAAIPAGSRLTTSSGSMPGGRVVTRMSACRRASKPQQAAGIKDRLALVIHGLAGELQAAQGGFVAGGVRIQRQHDAPGEALEQAQLVLGQGGAHRRDGVGEAGLVQGDHIQVALDDHHLVLGADGLAGRIEPVEQAALVEKVGLRGVEELGHILRVEDARPKACHAPAFVADGEHDAVAEAVVDTATAAA